MSISTRSVQKDFERIGAEGCYLLSLVKAAEIQAGRYIDPYRVYIEALGKQLIKENCFINDPAGIMALMLGGRWGFEKVPGGTSTKATDIVIFRYERKDGMKTWAHFVLANPDGKTIAFDPYGDSRTVREGALISKRVLWQIEKA